MKWVVRLEKRFVDNEHIIKPFIEGDIDSLKKVIEYAYKQGLTYYTTLDTDTLSDFLMSLFRDHGQFYEFIGFEYTSSHHPGDADFDSSCLGFEKFLQDYFGTTQWEELSEQQLNKLASILAERIKYLVEQYEQAKQQQYSVYSQVVYSPKPQEKAEEIHKIPLILKDAIVITNSKAYKITLVPIEQKSFNEIIEDATNSLKDIYNTQLQAKISVLQSRVEQLEQELEKTRSEAFILGLKTYEQIQQLGWRLKNGKLYYEHKIICKYVKKNDRIYKLPQQYIDEEKFYVKGIIIPIEQTVTKAHAEQHYHCNINDGGNICLGSLEGKDLLTVLEKLPEELETLNLDSAYDNSAKEELEDLIEELEQEEEFEVWEA